MERNSVSDFYQLLSLYEDYLSYGYERERGDDPGLSVVQTQTGEDSLDAIAIEVRSCRLCRLSATRKQPVPGMGKSSPLVLVVGEAPGAEEDAEGLPFVGAAGKYLDKWLAAIGLDRKTNTYITNVVKCRPPQNRDPLPEESACCLPFLVRQIDLLKPKAILTVGRISSQLLTGQALGIGQMRGRIYRYRDIPLFVTYHPSAVLRNQAEYRSPVWEDLKRLKEYLKDDLR